MRTPMVTRTIKSTVCTFLAMEVDTAEVKNVTLTLPRTYKSDEEILKVAKKQAETENFKIVAVVDKSEQENLYGMTEAKFIENAEIIPAKEAKTE